MAIASPIDDPAVQEWALNVVLPAFWAAQDTGDHETASGLAAYIASEMPGHPSWNRDYWLLVAADEADRANS